MSASEEASTLAKSNAAAADYDAAVVVAKGCPILMAPGARLEIRELAGY